jgi:hypothetical protein
MKLQRSDGTILIPYTSEFEYVDRQGVTVVAKGRVFNVGDQEVSLFPVGALCGMLGRTHKCIYKWEKNFGFPQAMWRVQNTRGCNRWYSKKQLLAIQSIYNHMGRLQKKNRSKLHAFVAAVRKVFFTIDKPIKER